MVERLVRRAYMAWNSLNDRYLEIQTDYSDEGPGAALPGYQGPHTERAVFGDNVRYVGLDYVRIRRMLKVLAPGAADVVYDLGSGKGRMLCMAARYRVQRVVGIELFPTLCDDARANAGRLRGRVAPIDVECGDAACADLSAGTIFLMFLPFGELTTRAVLSNIRSSLATHPRHVRIGYAHPRHEAVFREASWLEKYDAFRPTGESNEQFWRSVSFWRSR